MTERHFFPPRRDSHTDAEWHEVAAFLHSHQLDPHNLPAGEQITWDDAAHTITVTEWKRDTNGKLQVINGNQVMSRPVTFHATWSELPKTWQEAAL